MTEQQNNTPTVTFRRRSCVAAAALVGAVAGWAVGGVRERNIQHAKFAALEKDAHPKTPDQIARRVVKSEVHSGASLDEAIDLYPQVLQEAKRNDQLITARNL